MAYYGDYAEQYFNLGLKPTCISYLKTKYNINETNPEKSPCHSWRRWQVRKPDLIEIQNLPWDQSSGIGTVLGYFNRCIDIDNCKSVHLLKELLRLLGLPEDYEWAVKTPNGFHVHVNMENLPFVTNKELNEGVLALLPNDSYKNKFKRIELRWANHAVLPPTIINGMNYEFVFNNDALPKESPKPIRLDHLFFSLAKYCGTTIEINNYVASGSLIINDVDFRVTYCSESPAVLAAQKLLNNNHESVIEEDDNSDQLIGVWNSWRLKKMDGFDYYADFLHEPFFIDIETTGLIKDATDYNSFPRVIQIAYSTGNSGIRNHYIKPNGFIIPKEIEQLTGITNSFLEENGISIRNALSSFINKSVRSPIISYNTDFDLSILDSEFMRCGKENKDPIKNYLRDGSQIFCLMKKINSIFGGKYLKLSEAYEMFFKEPLPVNAHDAVNDLKVLIDCYDLMKLYGYISLGDKGRTLI
jgi:hypothetical protein